MVLARTGPSTLSPVGWSDTSATTSNDALRVVTSGVGSCQPHHQVLSGSAPAFVISSIQNIARLDSFYARLRHVLPRLRERTLQIDRAAGILDHVGLEALAPCIERAPGHAVIRCEPAQEYAVDAAAPEISGQSRIRLVLGFVAH